MHFESNSSLLLWILRLIEFRKYDLAVDKFAFIARDCIEPDDKSLAYLNCGFLHDRLSESKLAKDEFTHAIELEKDIDILFNRSKSLSYFGRSESKYRLGDFRGAVEDRLIASNIQKTESNMSIVIKGQLGNFKNVFVENSIEKKMDLKIQTLIKLFQVSKPKYDLIDDFKIVLTDSRKTNVINKLKKIYDHKYSINDYKGAIKAIRRLEKFL